MKVVSVHAVFKPGEHPISSEGHFNNGPRVLFEPNTMCVSTGPLCFFYGKQAQCHALSSAATRVSRGFCF